LPGRFSFLLPSAEPTADGLGNTFHPTGVGVPALAAVLRTLLTTLLNAVLPLPEELPPVLTEAGVVATPA